MRGGEIPIATSIGRASIYTLQDTYCIAGGCCKAFGEVFGLCAQLNNIGAPLNIDIVVNPLIDMRYDVAIGRVLAEYSRNRATDIDYEALLCTEQFDIRRSVVADLARPAYFRTDTMAETTENPPANGAKKGRARKLHRSSV